MKTIFMAFLLITFMSSDAFALSNTTQMIQMDQDGAACGDCGCGCGGKNKIKTAEES